MVELLIASSLVTELVSGDMYLCAVEGMLFSCGAVYSAIDRIQLLCTHSIGYQ